MRGDSGFSLRVMRSYHSDLRLRFLVRTVGSIADDDVCFRGRNYLQEKQRPVQLALAACFFAAMVLTRSMLVFWLPEYLFLSRYRLSNPRSYCRQRCF